MTSTSIKKPLPALCSQTAATVPLPYSSLYHNPLMDASSDDKENASPATSTTATASTQGGHLAAPLTGKRAALKPTSLQLCMRTEDEPSDPAAVRLQKLWDPPPPAAGSAAAAMACCEAWDLSDTEAAPASSWFTLPNRSLLCRPLPLDVGMCTCVIVKEPSATSKGVSLYSLYTNEGHGRQDRKLAVAWHRRRRGRSEFMVALNENGIFCRSDDNFLGTVTANLMGSKYCIWNQEISHEPSTKKSNRLLAVVTFASTVHTWTGSFRSMRAWIPKQQSLQLKKGAQIQHINGFPKDWQDKKNKCYNLMSKVPHYNNDLRRYELDYSERGGRLTDIQASVKNFQLVMEDKEKQLTLQFGKIEKSKYTMDFRHPLTGYQAFCISLASIDSKLCCSL